MIRGENVSQGYLRTDAWHDRGLHDVLEGVIKEIENDEDAQLNCVDHGAFDDYTYDFN